MNLKRKKIFVSAVVACAYLVLGKNFALAESIIFENHLECRSEADGRLVINTLPQMFGGTVTITTQEFDRLEIQIVGSTKDNVTGWRMETYEPVAPYKNLKNIFLYRAQGQVSVIVDDQRGLVPENIFKECH